MKFLTEKRDEEWDLDYLFRTLTKRRNGEKYIVSTENYDQVCNSLQICMLINIKNKNKLFVMFLFIIIETVLVHKLKLNMIKNIFDSYKYSDYKQHLY